MCSSLRTRNNLGYRNSSTSLQQQDGPLPGAFLPIELLLLIFHFGADLCDELPVTVSQTCRLWRWISIRSAALWCHIKPDRRRLLCVRRIQRSRNHPLYIEIAPPSPPVKCFSLLCHVHTLMASVLPVAERWRSLSIRFDEYVPFLWNSALSGLCTSSECHAVNSLESLSLIYPMNDDTKEFHLFADNAPKLKRVVVWGIRLRWTKSLFSNLEYLDYTHHGFNSGHEAVQEILRMLSISCPKLKKLSITFFQSTCDNYASFTGWLPHLYNKVVLYQVKELILRVNGPSPPKELKTLIRKLGLPSIVSLKLYSSYHNRLYSRKSLRSIIYPFRGHCRLKQVTVEGGWARKRMVQSIKSGIVVVVI